MVSYKSLFSRVLKANPERLHFAAHSHHAWPDCSFEAHSQAWLDAASLLDHKWDKVFAEVIPAAQAHIARQLSLPDPSTICFAPNTHEFVHRLHSALPICPKVLSSDAEFHSFNRQMQRWQEAGQVEWQKISAEPFESFGKRFLAAAREGRHDMIFLSQVFFNSAYVVDIFEELATILEGRETLLVMDGYHGFMAVPTSLAKIANRTFYIGGGYKYAMSGEGVCFMHCPPGYAMRPVNTGWFAGFAGLEGEVNEVEYAKGGMRFAGATFDVSGLYRFNAVQKMLLEAGLGVEEIHKKVQSLQTCFIEGIASKDFSIGELVPGQDYEKRGHFLTYRTKKASEISEALAKAKVMVDFRGDRLRFGFALYHDAEDVDELVRRLGTALAKG